MNATLLTLTEVAERLKVSRRTIERLISTGVLGHIKIGRNTRVEDGELDRYLAELRGSDHRPDYPITEGQIRAFHAKASILDRELSRKRGESKAEVFSVISSLIGRTIASTSELSSREASTALDLLEDALIEIGIGI